MRIIGGAWRGGILAAPRGGLTRPTADRVRQAMFDMLQHAPWADAEVIAGARVLDAFAGSGGLGLEALSRGAAHATFMESDPVALGALRANIEAFAAWSRVTILAGDVLRCVPGEPVGLAFLDPPYGRTLIPRALARLRKAGWIAEGGLVVAEIGRGEPVPVFGQLLADRAHGAARILVWRAPREGVRPDAPKADPGSGRRPQFRASIRPAGKRHTVAV